MAARLVVGESHVLRHNPKDYAAHNKKLYNQNKEEYQYIIG